MNLFFQLQDGQGRGLLGPLCGQLPRPHLHEGEGQGLPALRQVRVPAAEVVHARHRVHLQPVDQERDQVLRQRPARLLYGDGLAGQHKRRECFRFPLNIFCFRHILSSALELVENLESTEQFLFKRLYNKTK